MVSKEVIVSRIWDENIGLLTAIPTPPWKEQDVIDYYIQSSSKKSRTQMQLLTSLEPLKGRFSPAPTWRSNLDARQLGMR